MATPGASPTATASTPAARSFEGCVSRGLLQHNNNALRLMLRDSSSADADDLANQDPNNRINQINKAYQAKDADVVLVSAEDLLHFRCHSFQLMAASHVFKDMMYGGMHSSANPRIIELSDSANENGPAIRLLLDFFYGRWTEVFEKPKEIDTGSLISVAYLFDKLNCPAMAQILTKTIEHALVYRSLSPITAFVVGAHLADVNLCALAITRGGHWAWAKPEGRRLSNGVEGGSIFDLRAMPRVTFRQIPPDYAQALLRATLSVKLDIPVKESNPDWKKVSVEFERLWREQKGEFITMYKPSSRLRSGSVIVQCLWSPPSVRSPKQNRTPRPESSSPTGDRVWKCHWHRSQMRSSNSAECSIDGLLHFIRFLDKFGCNHPQRLFDLHLCENLNDEAYKDPIKVFILAAHLDYPDTCVRALRRGLSAYTLAVVKGVHDCNNETVDISPWDQELFQKVPRTYAWALMRATRSRCLDSGNADWKKIIEDFEELVDDC